MDNAAATGNQLVKSIGDRVREFAAIPWPVALSAIALWRYSVLEFFPRSMLSALTELDPDYHSLARVPLDQLVSERTAIVHSSIALVSVSLPLVALALRYGVHSWRFTVTFVVQLCIAVLCATLWPPTDYWFWNFFIGLSLVLFLGIIFESGPRPKQFDAPLARLVTYGTFTFAIWEAFYLLPSASGRWWGHQSLAERQSPNTIYVVSVKMGNSIENWLGLILWQNENHVLFGEDLTLPPPGEIATSTQPWTISLGGRYAESGDIGAERYVKLLEGKSTLTNNRTAGVILIRRDTVYGIKALIHPQAVIREVQKTNPNKLLRWSIKNTGNGSFTFEIDNRSPATQATSAPTSQPTASEATP